MSIINEEDREAQQNEIEILTEILDEEELLVNYLGDVTCGQMKVKVRLPFALKCGYVVETESEEECENKPKSSKKLNLEIVTLNHMPPLELHFTLPVDYPSKSKPIFTLSCKWLSRNCLSRICEKLDSLWEENKGMAILYSWYTFLQDDLAGCLGLSAESVHDLTFCYRKSSPLSSAAASTSGSKGKQSSKIRGDHNSILKSTSVDETRTASFQDQEIENNSVSNSECRKLKHSLSILDSRAVFERVNEPINEYLLRYEKEETTRVFLRSDHACEICLSEKRGVECLKLECQHVYCKSCLFDFFSLHITEGSLDNIRCPNFDCKIVPYPYQVKAIVNDELFQRYDRLLLTKSLDNMSDVVSCPRITCGRPVVYDPADKLAKCLSCDYAFCRHCKTVYHGIEPCRFRSGEARILYEKYANGTADEKKQLEKKYGKKQLELLVEQTLSEEWVSRQAKPCPHCKVPIETTMSSAPIFNLLDAEDEEEENYDEEEESDDDVIIIDETHVVTPIRNLQANTSATFRGIVLWKKQCFLARNGKTYISRVRVGDASNYHSIIQISGLGQAAKWIQNNLEYGKSYEFEGLRLIKSNRRFVPNSHEVEARVQCNISTAKEIPTPPSFPTRMYYNIQNFTEISQLISSSCIEIVGVIHSLGDILRRGDHYIRKVTLVDDSKYKLEFYLWNEDLQHFHLETGCTLLLQGLKVMFLGNEVDFAGLRCKHMEKWEGCNKVTCFKCLKAFCWLCSAQLNQENPYFHFNDPQSKCYNNLFQGVEPNAQEDEDDQNEEDFLNPQEWARLHRDVQFVREIALGEPHVFFI